MIKEFWSRATAMVGHDMSDMLRQSTIMAARATAPEYWPDLQVTDVEITDISTYPTWDRKTGEVTEMVDWVARADVHMEPAQ